ncbi:zinc finger protein 3-like isoform X2 [Neocloeon triangulifer]|uniref:zinc finger protein 3-like isoform X2 n=1 Tax=Neocloeon triangulifer TaxID=2078957 RepID=UPI00286F959B|nr:zinc finger protein 3-like isoform X2 [Neocloeon triangulifer]
MATSTRAHRSVLASCSPYFDSILKMHRVVKERLTVTCQNSEVFHCLINYMYTGIVLINEANVAEMLRLANHFLVSKLKTHCEEFLDKNLRLDNCLQTRHLADKYDMTDLIRNVAIFVRAHVHQIVKQQDFLQFSSNQIQDFLSDKTLELDVLTLLDVACCWISHDLTTRESIFPTLLEIVADWSGLSEEQVKGHLDSQALYASSTECLNAVLENLVRAERLPPQYRPTYDALNNKETATVEPEEPPQDDAQEFSDDHILLGLHEPLSDSIRNEERPKHKRKSSTIAHLWRTPSARLQALRKIHGKMQALQSLDEADLSPGSTHQDDACTETMATDNGQDDDEVFRCHLCEFSTFSVTELEQHAATVHAHDVRYKCNICEFACNFNKDYYSHMREHFPGPPFACDNCEYRCDRIHQVLSHRLQHSDEKPFCCHECGFKCRTKPNLTQHQRSHTGQRPFTCEACGRSFGMKSTLEQHLATHSSDRPYLCDTCGFSTKYLSHLIAHKRIHTGEVHKCSYPQCRYTTPKRSQLGSHMRTHMGVRPHTCSTCGRGFLEKSHLVRHERIHLEDKPFKCSQCDYASSRRDKLKEHFNRHHGQNASAKVPYRPRPPRTRLAKMDELELLLGATGPSGLPQFPSFEHLKPGGKQVEQLKGGSLHALPMMGFGQQAFIEPIRPMMGPGLGLAQGSLVDYSLQACMPLF